jgi:hypothetical protein
MPQASAADASNNDILRDFFIVPSCVSHVRRGLPACSQPLFGELHSVAGCTDV